MIRKLFVLLSIVLFTFTSGCKGRNDSLLKGDGDGEVDPAAAKAKTILAARYLIESHGLDKLKKVKGPIFLLFQHPAHIDPVISSVELWNTISEVTGQDMRPIYMMDEDISELPVVNNLVEGNIIKVPSQRRGRRAEWKIAQALKAAVNVLRNGMVRTDGKKTQILAMSPVGYILREGTSNLGLQNGASDVLRNFQPGEVTVAVLTFKGLRGSVFSIPPGEDKPAYTASVSALPRVLIRFALGLGTYVFRKQRKVDLFFHVFDDFPAGQAATPQAVNAKLTEVLDADPDVEPTYTPYTKLPWWFGHGLDRILGLYNAKKEKIAKSDVDPEFVNNIKQMIAAEVDGLRPEQVEAYAEKITLEDRLDRHIASSKVTRLLTKISKEFNFEMGDPGVPGVGQFIEAAWERMNTPEEDRAVEKAESNRFIRWFKNRNMKRWWRQARTDRSRPAVVKEEGGNNIDLNFLYTVRDRPNEPMFHDETFGFVTRLEFAALVAGLIPQMEATPGRLVGHMIPNSVIAAATEVAIRLAGKVPVNFNAVAGEEAVRASYESLKPRGLEKIVTAEKALRLLDDKGFFYQTLEEDGTFVTIDGTRKLLNMMKAAAPYYFGLNNPNTGRLSELIARAQRIQPNSEAVILLTSGSESAPKAVPLTHTNLMANLRMVTLVLQFVEGDTIMGMLPFFHSFGVRAIDIPMVMEGLRAVFHTNPKEAARIVELIRELGITFYAATPTLASDHADAGTREDFKTVNTLVVGAEALNDQTRTKLRDKFGVEPQEGYGITETSPFLAVELGKAAPPEFQGWMVLLPGIEHQLATMDGQVIPSGEGEGILRVKGESIFGGYANTDKDPFINGYYDTSDVVKLKRVTWRGQEYRLIKIIGRAKRFTKAAGGEMISHPAMESILVQAFGIDTNDFMYESYEPKDGRPPVFGVVATKKACEKMNKETVNDALASKAPSVAKVFGVICVDEIPVLPTGKQSLQGVKQLIAFQFNEQTGAPQENTNADACLRLKEMIKAAQ